MQSAAADYLIDMGPGAGVHGGEVIAAEYRARFSNRPRASPRNI